MRRAAPEDCFRCPPLNDNVAEETFYDYVLATLSLTDGQFNTWSPDRTSERRRHLTLQPVPMLWQ